MQCLRKIINQKITDNLATFDSGVFSFLFFHTQSCWSCESKTLEVHLSFVANKTFNKTFDLLLSISALILGVECLEKCHYHY